MPTMTIRVAGKAEPKLGKKRGRIEAEGGMLFQAMPELLAQVKVGSTYDLAFKNEQFGETKYRVVEAIYAPSGEPESGVHAAPSTGGTSPRTYSLEETLDTRPELVSTPERIYVCGVMNAAVSSGRADPASVADQLAIISAASTAFRTWHGLPTNDSTRRNPIRDQAHERIHARPSLKDEMDDEIPESFR